MMARRSTRLVRWWVGLYTRGLPSDVRDGRREEIEADLWGQLEDATPSGRSDRSTASEIVTRLVLGLPADLTWRIALWADQYARPATGSSAKRDSRVSGLLAIVGGLAFTIAAAIFAGVTLANSSRRPWQGDMDPLQASIMTAAGTVGLIAIAVAAVGLVRRYRHHASKRAMVAALAAAVAVVLGLLDVWPAMYFVPVGLSFFVWDLGRAGVFRTGPAALNMASAWVILVPLATMGTEIPVGLAVLLILPYPITWLVIGGSLLKATPAAQGA